MRRQIDVHVFDAYGGRLVLAVPKTWQVTCITLGESSKAIDPLAKLQVRRPEDVTGLTQSGPPQVLRLQRDGSEVELIAAKSSRVATADRVCPTDESFPVEVVTIKGVEVLLLRPDKLAPSASESSSE